MSDVTQILTEIESGDPRAAEQLLPLVYNELRRLAAAKLAQEHPGHTLQPTALVHEVYIRLVDAASAQEWNSRGHFFAAAAEAMRRILVEGARRKQGQKHGGGARRMELTEVDLVMHASPDELLSLDEALAKLAGEDARGAEIAKLHVFTGLSVDEAGRLLGLSRATAYRHWTYARAWLRAEMQGRAEPEDC